MGGAVPILRENCSKLPHFPHFHLLKPLSNEDLYIFYLHLFIATTLLATLLINLIVSWKRKLKITDVDIKRFFQDAKFSLTKRKKYLLEASYGTSRTSKFELYQLLLWWILLLLTINLNPAYLSTDLRRINMLKTDFSKIPILSKFWEWRKWQGVVGRGGHLVILFSSLWRIAYENRYVTRPSINLVAATFSKRKVFKKPRAKETFFVAAVDVTDKKRVLSISSHPEVICH